MKEFKNFDNVTILAIETSCDETSVAVVKNGKEVLSNIVSSQIETHKQFGGVVPEIASRQHIEVVMQIVEEALEEAKTTLDEIDAICVTQGPGLIGSLLVGVNVAKTLSYALDKPLIAAHHIAGHIYASNIDHDIVYPSLALVVSGGHTELVYLKDELDFEIIGSTHDDAVGEAYDKVARQLNLEYPGGPKVDKLAKLGEDKYKFPRAMIDSDDYNIARDEFELALLKEALRQNKPVMAICRGLQLVNVAFGGTLNQQIDNHWQGQPFGTSHSIRTEKGSVVERLFGQASRINSVHRQSIKDLAPNFRATAFDPRDNTIEAIESIDNHRIIGLQWHPEFLIGEEKGNLELFHYLLQEL